MKKTLKNLLFTGAIGMTLLSGCEPTNPNRQDRATLITYKGNTDKRFVEKFYDLDNDGSVEAYVIGPPISDDISFPDNTSELTQAFMSINEGKEFKIRFGELPIGLRYTSEQGKAYLIGGIKAEVMSPEMQQRVNSKYAAINSDPRDLEVIQSK